MFTDLSSRPTLIAAADGKRPFFGYAEDRRGPDRSGRASAGGHSVNRMVKPQPGALGEGQAAPNVPGK